MPALAMGLSQRDLGNLKDLENDVLKLGEKLIPPSTSYTQSANEGDGNSEEDADGKGKTGEPVETDIDDGGRPKKKEGEKQDSTITTEEARK